MWPEVESSEEEGSILHPSSPSRLAPWFPSPERMEGITSQIGYSPLPPSPPPITLWDYSDHSLPSSPKVSNIYTNVDLSRFLVLDVPVEGALIVVGCPQRLVECTSFPTLQRREDLLYDMILSRLETITPSLMKAMEDYRIVLIRKCAERGGEAFSKRSWRKALKKVVIGVVEWLQSFLAKNKPGEDAFSGLRKLPKATLLELPPNNDPTPTVTATCSSPTEARVEMLKSRTTKTRVNSEDLKLPLGDNHHIKAGNALAAEAGALVQTPMSVCGASNSFFESNSTSNGTANAKQQSNEKTPLRFHEAGLNSEDFQTYNSNGINGEAAGNVGDQDHGTQIEETLCPYDTSDRANASGSAEVLDDTIAVIQKNKGKTKLKTVMLSDIERLRDGKITLDKAAEQLGVSKSTLKRKCRSFGINHWTDGKIMKDEHSLRVNSINASGGPSKVVDSVTVKAWYGAKIYSFDLPVPSKMEDLMMEVKKRTELEAGKFSIKYKDEDDDLICVDCSDDWKHCVKTMGSQTKIRLFIERCDGQI